MDLNKKVKIFNEIKHSISGHSILEFSNLKCWQKSLNFLLNFNIIIVNSIPNAS